MTRCIGLFGSVFGHAFKPIYSETATALRAIGSPRAYPDADYLTMLDKFRDTSKKFEGLVCLRCGELQK